MLCFFFVHGAMTMYLCIPVTNVNVPRMHPVRVVVVLVDTYTHFLDCLFICGPRREKNEINRR